LLQDSRVFELASGTGFTAVVASLVAKSVTASGTLSYCYWLKNSKGIMAYATKNVELSHNLWTSAVPELLSLQLGNMIHVLTKNSG
jgi:hypothetical protein